MSELHDIAMNAREASYIMASLNSDVKNRALANVAKMLKENIRASFCRCILFYINYLVFFLAF